MLVFQIFFTFLCPSVCLSRSLCVSVRLFTINLKFLKTNYNYRLAQLVSVSLVSGLKLKKYKLRIKMLRNSGISARVLVKKASLATINLQVVLLDLCVVWWFCEMFVICLSSYLSVFLSPCEQLHWELMLHFAVFLHVPRRFLNQSDFKLQCSRNG